MINTIVFSSGRADYFILRTLIGSLACDPRFGLKVLCPIEVLQHEKSLGKLSLGIDETDFLIVENHGSSSKSELLKNISAVTGKYSYYLDQVQPDLVIVLGDRYETLLFSGISKILNVQIAHFHGGEITVGSQDDRYRHAITKLSDLHFVQNNDARDVLIQLGENGERIHVVGPLWLTNLQTQDFAVREELERLFNITFSEKNILVTWHPNTVSPYDSEREFEIVLSAIENISDCGFVFTAPNNDLFGQGIRDSIVTFCSHRPNCSFVESFGFHFYAMMQQVDLMIGNSSSGLLEFPYFHKPTINIGERQRGRKRALSVFDCKLDSLEIESSIRELLGKVVRSDSRFGGLFVADRQLNASQNLRFILNELFITRSMKYTEKVFERHVTRVNPR